MTPQKKTAAWLSGIAGTMLALSFAAVPFYDLFCRVTGYGGTTSVSDAAPGEVLDQTILIRFDASLEAGMPWEFHPQQNFITLRIGETALAFYEAYNPTDHAVAGTASYNVAPDLAGGYFTKIECFCFTEQRLEPGAEIDMPVTFFVDPKIADDRDTDDITTITLSYTFFQTEADTDRSPRAATASPKTNG